MSVAKCHILNPRPLYPNAGSDNKAFNASNRRRTSSTRALQATVAEVLDRLVADYGSGSDDADASEKSPEVIDVDQVEDSRMKELRKKWTAQVRFT